jgi:hypothetical protein
MLAGLVIFSVIAFFGNLPRLLGALSSKRLPSPMY